MVAALTHVQYTPRKEKHEPSWVVRLFMRRDVQGMSPGTDANRWVVVYDGECEYCRRQVARIRERDVDARFELIPRQTEGLIERFPSLAEGDFDAGMRLIAPDGRVYIGPDAVYQIARRLPGWRHMTWLYRVPGLRGLFRRAYGWVAANRYALSGECRDKACGRPAGGPNEPASRSAK